MSMAVSVIFFLLIWAVVVILQAKKCKTESRAFNIKLAICCLFSSILTYVFIATGSVKDGFLYYMFWFFIIILLCACGTHLKNAFSKKNIPNEQPGPQKDCDCDDPCLNKSCGTCSCKTVGGFSPMEDDLDDTNPPRGGSGIPKK